MKALIAMSGGVDSSVAAAKMQADGYECIGITMKLYDNEDIGLSKTKTCCSLDDTEDARRVCERLGIPFYVNNFKDDFATCVIDKFIAAYRLGHTPNPCIECNRFLKFERLYNRAKELGCDVIVTGHYARVLLNEETGEYELHKGQDPAKDQSYVLYMLSQEQLSHTRFPIGEMCKEETRRIAEDKGFVNANKPDSQDICFIPDGDYRGFLERQGIISIPGDFVLQDGTVLGIHTGICNYTVGQRKGLGISAKAPLYVKRIDPESNKVILSDNESLFGSNLVADDFCWTMENPDKLIVDGVIRCKARIRYHHKEAEASVYLLDDKRVKVSFDEPQRAITCGQAVVLYNDSRVLGGGTIVEAE